VAAMDGGVALRGGGEEAAPLPAPPRGLARHRRVPAPTVAPPARLRTPPFADYIGEFELVDDHRSGKIVVDVSAAGGALRAPLRVCVRARGALPPSSRALRCPPPCHSSSAASTSAA
jgi:hypothetical protein